MALSRAMQSLAGRRMAVVALAQRVPQHQRRHMSLHGHHGPPPDWQGVDKIVRAYFPEDYQLAMAILGGYVGLYGLYSVSTMFRSKPKPVEIKAKVEVTSDSAIPDVESPAFDAFVASGGLDKLLENEAQLKAMTE